MLLHLLVRIFTPRKAVKDYQFGALNGCADEIETFGRKQRTHDERLSLATDERTR